MKAIHKYKIGKERNTQTINLKKGYKIVRSEYIVIEKAVFLWIEEPLAIDVESHDVTFKLAMTGDPLGDNDTHVATAIDTFGPEAYHIFEKAKETENSSRSHNQHIKAA